MPLRLEVTASAQPQIHASKVSLLLVEDSEDDLLLTMRAFKKCTIELDDVVVARDGVEALDWLFARGEHEGRNPAPMPRLVLLDVKLPKMNGLEVLRAMRADPRTRLVPVVMLTSSAAEQDVMASYGAGANGYIQKPVNSRHFEEVVEQVLSYWLGVNRAPGSNAEELMGLH